jgi:hypothetical protein
MVMSTGRRMFMSTRESVHEYEEENDDEHEGEKVHRNNSDYDQTCKVARVDEDGKHDWICIPNHLPDMSKSPWG